MADTYEVVKVKKDELISCIVTESWDMLDELLSLVEESICLKEETKDSMLLLKCCNPSCQSCPFYILKRLCEIYPDEVMKKDVDGNSVLQLLIMYNEPRNEKFPLFKLLLEVYKMEVSNIDDFGETALLCSIEYNRYTYVKYLTRNFDSGRL